MTYSRARPVLAALLLLLLTLFFFWKILFTNLILVGVDSFLYFYPYKAYVAETLRSGRFPLWNPYLFMGVPLFANMQTAVLYPLHWPLLWLSAPRQVAVSIVLHVVLAGWGMLLYTRRTLKLSWPGALSAAIIFCLGGFLGAQVEHVNQLNVIAWLPWAFFLLDSSAKGGTRLAPVLGLGMVITLMLLAGHAQATYICLAGLVIYGVAGGSPYRVLAEGLGAGGYHTPPPKREGRRAGSRGVIRLYHTARLYLVSRVPYLVALGAAGLVALLLSLVQLLPALELSRLSVRSEGLPYREAASFSLRPWQLHLTLLPPFGVDLSQVFGEAYSEYVAYIGLIGLGLAALGLLRGRPEARWLALLAATGLFLGLGGFNPVYSLLYKILPGFDLFRAPARWMLLYAFGMAGLAGLGLEYVSRIKSPISNLQSPLLLCLVCVELFLASQGLRYNQPTAPEAFTFLRPSIAHLKADPGLHRFLSLSGIRYDPGDLAEIRAIFAGQLPERSIYDYIVAAKEKEVLAYNLPLLYGLYSVDGYDGGLLPLRDFVTMQRLFLDEENLSLDGRLRENLRDVPPGRLLSLLGARYIITDKVYDVWIDNVFYDLQFNARLSAHGISTVGTNDLPVFPTTALGLVSYLDGAEGLPDGSVAARIKVADTTGWSEAFELLAGRDTSEGRYSQRVAHRQARVGHTWRDDETGKDYITLIPLDGPRTLTDLSIQAVSPVGEFVLRGLSLVDTRTTTSRQVTLSTEGQYRLVHSGDVKIYENLGALPRAFITHQAEVIPDPDRAIARLRDPEFDPSQTVILAGGESLRGEGSGVAEVVRYTPEEIIIEARTDSPGYLVLADSFYPGWEATVDDQPVEILRADIMFRAVRLEPGEHRIVFRYRPAAVWWGARVSGAALLLWITCFILLLRRRSNPSPSPTPTLSG